MDEMEQEETNNIGTSTDPNLAVNIEGSINFSPDATIREALSILAKTSKEQQLELFEFLKDFEDFWVSKPLPCDNYLIPTFPECAASPSSAII